MSNTSENNVVSLKSNISMNNKFVITYSWKSTFRNCAQKIWKSQKMGAILFYMRKKYRNNSEFKRIELNKYYKK